MGDIGGVEMHKDEAFTWCTTHMYRYVMVQTNDGMTYDGIIESVDNDNVYLAVPVGEAEARQPVYGTPGYGYGGYGYGYPGYYPGYPGYYVPRRRFRRTVLPLATLLALSLLPYY